ncbi:Pkinase-domain-containing protein [Eremomyces bilateralis CBS 781.70]|uniref:cyclin-dependent kinase n=1 Tax=Eremomyces bilateralis CBS 781.70 TaxID=1392243 RepID=A0A6G1G4S9_9PEZI|nr:Pkinase-domain-containing protein [Eremomyces bilateralis CBS 781.70]KAF1813054.1 Pkinase-domain-containing protein [Eremomyces bilateralis CBS 781.70]
MASNSRWADTEEDTAAEIHRKREKEERKRAKQLKAQQEQEAREAREAQAKATSSVSTDIDDRPAKRRRLSGESESNEVHDEQPRPLLRFTAPGWGPSRRIENFETLNHIEEGSYGWVSRAREMATGEIVALKKLKMGNPTEGFPVVALREIQILNQCRHKHIVALREVVVGSKPSDVYMVMEFLEHDLKSLMEDMREPFSPSETKSLLLQLSSAVSYLHSHWILHRDLKTSNILMNNLGQIRLADFGMARHTSNPPPKNLTQLVVTLWYRSPELLLGTTTYGTAVDIWSIGCVFAELLTRSPLLQGRNEADQLAKIFATLGIPTAANWPGFRRLPHAKSLALPSNPPPPPPLRSSFSLLTGAGAQLLERMLALNPDDRPEAEEVLQHRYFQEDPKPKSEKMFPTFPSKAGQERRRRVASPKAPRGREADAGAVGHVDFGGIFSASQDSEAGSGFNLKFR